MAKQLKDILNGVKASKVVPGSTGSDPGVDYAPKAPNEQEFVKKHSTEKHEDRVGNGDDVYQASNIKHSMEKPGEERHGHKTPKDKKVYEATKCNMTEEGTACPVHEMADCSKPKKTLKEIAKNPYAIGMAAAMKKTGDKPPLKKSTITKAHDIAKSVAKEEVEQVDEVSKDTLQRYMHAAKSERMDPEKGKQRRAGMDLALKKVLGSDHLGRKPKVKAAGQSKKELGESLAVPLLGGVDDESAEMAKTQLRALANKAMHLALQLSDDQIVEPWVQSKIALAKDYVTTVHDYMLYGDNNSKKEQAAPYDGGIDMSGAPRNTLPSFSADVNTGRVV